MDDRASPTEVEDPVESSDPRGDDTTDDNSGQRRAVLVGLGAGVGGFVAFILWTFVLLFGFVAVSGTSVEEITSIQEAVVSTLALGFGMATGAALYLHLSHRSLSFLDVRLPTLRDVGYMIGGLIGLFAAVIAIGFVTEALGVSPSDHGIIEDASDGNAEILLVLVPLSLLVIGPGEELLFRNVVQKHLYDAFSREEAIVIASSIFAVVHVPAYATGTPGQIATSITVIFVLSLLLGWVYHRTENLVVPALIHGCYNALLFGSLYLELTGAV